MKAKLFFLGLIAHSCITVSPLCAKSDRLSLFQENSSDSFILRWPFQNLCNHIFDPVTNKTLFPTDHRGITTFDPKDVQPGDLIFVRNPQLFLEEVADKITHPYIIITHGTSEDQFKDSFSSLLDNKNIIAWFTIHPTNLVHPKLFHIPVGVRQVKQYHEKKTFLANLFRELRATKKDKLVYLNIAQWTHPDRSRIVTTYENMRGCLSSPRVPFLRYLKDMARCKFTFSPPGIGIDANRTWEALLVGSIPIVISSPLDDLYEGLPVLIIKDWNCITEDFLEEKYKEITSKTYSLEKLYMNFWTKKIMQVRHEFLMKKGVSSSLMPNQNRHTLPNHKQTRQKGKLKILVVSSHFPKLSEPFVVNQIVGLINNGHDVSIYADFAEKTDKKHQDIIKYGLMQKVYYDDLPNDIHDYDLILCEFGTMGQKLLKWKQFYSIPAKLVTFFRGYDISEYIHENPEAYDDLYVFGDFFLTNCDFFRNKAIRLGCPQDRIVVNYSSINCNLFTYREKEPNFEKEIKIITMGRLVEKKGIEDALQVVALLKKKYPQINYIIAGDGPRKDMLQGIATDLGIADIVTFTGPYTINELPGILERADIFLGPSVTAKNFNEDAIPNTIKEAMAVGLPVVCTNHGGIPELIKHGENGFLAEEHDIEGLARNVETLIENPRLIRKFSKAGRAAIEKNFELHTINKKLSGILEKVVEENYEQIIHTYKSDLRK